jgi:ABC-type transport system substrate-binding protein
VDTTAHHDPTAAPNRCPKRNPATGSITVGMLQAPPINSLFWTGAVFSTVFGVDQKGRVFPEMATRIPTLQNGAIRDGGRSYVIHLKPEMFWSNGAEITSADAVFGWKIAYDSMAGPPYTCQPSCPITAVDTPDRYTAVYHLKTIDHAFLEADIPQLWPTRWTGAWNDDPHAALLKMQDSSFWAGPSYPTDGPYRVVRLTDANHMRLRPMKYYDILSCGAYIKNLTYVNYPTLNEEVAALSARKVDLVEQESLEDLPAVERVRSPYRVHVDPFFGLEHVEFNVDPIYGGKPNPLHDTRVRQALALAVDKRALIASALHLNDRQVSNVIQWSFCVASPKYRTACADPKLTGQWDPIARRYDPNPGRGVALLDAKKLLSETPWRRGFALDFIVRTDVPRRAPEEAALAVDWARLGVKVKPIKVSGQTTVFGSYTQGGVLARGQFQAVLIQFTGGNVDLSVQYELASAAIDRRAKVHDASLQNYAGIDDPVIDRAIATAEGTLDEKVRTREFDVIQEELAQKAYWDPIYSPAVVYVEDQRIANLSDSVNSSVAVGSEVYWNEWAWKAK